MSLSGSAVTNKHPSYILVEYFVTFFFLQALLQSTVQQQEAAIEKQYILAIEKHSHKCEELLDAQVWMCTYKNFHDFLLVSTPPCSIKMLTYMIPKENDPSPTLFPQHTTKHKYLKIRTLHLLGSKTYYNTGACLEQNQGECSSEKKSQT